jgi:hypothetical protein
LLGWDATRVSSVQITFPRLHTPFSNHRFAKFNLYTLFASVKGVLTCTSCEQTHFDARIFQQIYKKAH